MTTFKIEKPGNYDNLVVSKNSYSKTIGTDLLTVFPREIPSGPSLNGSFIYDKLTNEFKGYINGSWQTIATGGSLPVITANDKELLFKNATTNEIQGSSDLEWDYNNSKLTIGSSTTSDAYLVMTPRTGGTPPAGAPEGSIKYFNGDLQCLKGSTWTSLTQVGTGSNAAGPIQSVQFNSDGMGTFGGDPNFLWDNTNDILTIGSNTDNLKLSSTTTPEVNFTANSSTIFNISQQNNGIVSTNYIQLLRNDTGGGWGFNYPTGPGAGLQLKGSNIQFMQTNASSSGSGFQFIFDNDSLSQGDSIFRISKGITGQSINSNTVFSCDGFGNLGWTGEITNNINPLADNTYSMGSSSNSWNNLTVNNITSGGILNTGTNIAPNDLVINSAKIMPEFGFNPTGQGQDIGELSSTGGSGVGGFRRVYAREFYSGANSNANGSFLAYGTAGTSLASLSGGGPDLLLNNSIQSSQVSLSSNSNLITGSTNPVLYFEKSSEKSMILYGNSNVTGGNRDKVLNIGWDSTLTNSPITATEGYQMQFTLGTAGTGQLDIAGNTTVTKTVTGQTLTDGTATISGGDGTFNNVFLSGVDGSGASITTVENRGKPIQQLGFKANGTGTNAVASGIANVIRGGVMILPNSKYLGNTSPTPLYTDNPQPDSNLILGQYGWGTLTGAQPNNVNSAWKNEQTAIAYGGSGNVYCNTVRENVYYWMPTSSVAPGTSSNPNGRTWGGTGALSMDSPPNVLYPTGQGNHSWGYIGNSSVGGWYNNGNIRNLVVDVGGSVSGSSGANTPGSGSNGFAVEVRLPQINEAMVGMKVTVTRARVAPHNPNGASPGAYTTAGINSSAKIEFHKIAVVIKSSGNTGADTDLISAPDSICVYDAALGSPHVALDPYRVLVPYPNGTSNPTSGYRGNQHINKWAIIFSPAQTLNTDEFPRSSTTAAVPGVTIIQLNAAGTDVFYGTLVETIKNSAGDVTAIIFTSPATSVGLVGVYNFVTTRDLYIGGSWNGATVSGAQQIANANISSIRRFNLGAAPNPSTPERSGFPEPYTSISSATFQAMATGNGTRELGTSPAKYVWHYIDSYPTV